MTDMVTKWHTGHHQTSKGVCTAVQYQIGSVTWRRDGIVMLAGRRSEARRNMDKNQTETAIILAYNTAHKYHS